MNIEEGYLSGHHVLKKHIYEYVSQLLEQEEYDQWCKCNQHCRQNDVDHDRMDMYFDKQLEEEYGDNDDLTCCYMSD